MDQRTRACVSRMQAGDIASLPGPAYHRAIQCVEVSSWLGIFRAELIDGLRGLWIRQGMDPEVGQQWIREAK